MPRVRIALLTALLALAAAAPASAAPTPRVINGNDAGADDYPWTVALVQAGGRGINGQFCGGTLVTATTVVTAAHCVEGSTRDDIEVLAGVRTLSDATELDYYPVASISVAPGTRFPNDALIADVATLELDVPVTGAEPIAVVGAGIAPPAALRVAGWGEWTTPPLPTDFPDTLQWADLDHVDDATCGDESKWGADLDPTTMFCALETNPVLRDSCNGDSGGPLTNVAPDETVATGWVLHGVVSFGSTECNNPNLPGIYARLADPALNAFVANAMDGNAANGPSPQPEHRGGSPTLSGTPAPGSTLSCAIGSTLFGGGMAGDPRQVVLNVVHVTTGLPVVGGTSYAVTAADVGKRFACRARATLQTGGGTADAFSAQSDTVRAPQVVNVQVPGPTVSVPVPTPGPVQLVPVPIAAPRVADTAAPRVLRVRRSCTKQRRCTFTVTTSDASPSAGVTALTATATTLKARTCRKRGRRTVCATVTERELTARRRSENTFTVTSSRAFPRGRHTLVLVAADGAGNIQAKPHRTAFNVR